MREDGGVKTQALPIRNTIAEMDLFFFRCERNFGAFLRDADLVLDPVRDDDEMFRDLLEIAFRSHGVAPEAYATAIGIPEAIIARWRIGESLPFGVVRPALMDALARLVDCAADQPKARAKRACRRPAGRAA